jgi:hypothetical protein
MNLPIVPEQVQSKIAQSLGDYTWTQMESKIALEQTHCNWANAQRLTIILSLRQLQEIARDVSRMMAGLFTIRLTLIPIDSMVTAAETRLRSQQSLQVVNHILLMDSPSQAFTMTLWHALNKVTTITLIITRNQARAITILWVGCECQSTGAYLPIFQNKNRQAKCLFVRMKRRTQTARQSSQCLLKDSNVILRELSLF